MSDIEVTQEQMSYFQSYIQAFNNQSIYGSYLLSPQLLNDTLKSLNMNTSKLCSCCGSIKKDLKLSDRIYKCECGNVVDRDYQAALNLKRYGKNVIKQSVA